MTPFKKYVRRKEGYIHPEFTKKYRSILDYALYDYPKKSITHLHVINSKKNAPRGTGTAFMRDFVKWADENGRTIVLNTAKRGDFGIDPEYKKTTSAARLVAFYKTFGFKSNYSRRSYRPDLGGNMHRLPEVNTEDESSSS